MNNNNNTTTETRVDEQDIPSPPLISEENFQLLKESQRRIAQDTGISPTVRIIVNRLISKEQLAKVENGLISQLKQLGTA